MLYHVTKIRDAERGAGAAGFGTGVQVETGQIVAMVTESTIDSPSLMDTKKSCQNFSKPFLLTSELDGANSARWL